jgi:hypothetical protein
MSVELKLLHAIPRMRLKHKKNKMFYTKEIVKERKMYRPSPLGEG